MLGGDRIKGQWVVIGLGVVGAIVGAGAGFGAEPAGELSPLILESTTPSPSVVPVHVSGLVVSPGVVWVNEGALTIDAIAAAGGALIGADLDSINLARPVFEGDQVVVGSIRTRTAGSGGVGGDGLIDINSDDSAQLQTLPGVGPVLAANIIAYRDSNGRFESIEDLLEVPGIGESRLASIRDLIRPP
jgi:competence protein ComEA